jgi:6-phosphofructokinase 1
VQRGGEPTAYDRNLATKLGTAAAEMIIAGDNGFMVGMKANKIHKSTLMKKESNVISEITAIDELLHKMI